MEKVEFSSKVINIHYDAEKNQVHMEWKGFAKSELYQEALNKGLEIAKKHRAPYWIGNLSNMGVITQADQEWTNNVWFPQLIKAGVLQKMAVVVSKDEYNRMSVDRLMSKANDIIKFDIKYFNDINEAKEWANTLATA